MRAILFCLTAACLAAPHFAHAETRYFTSLNGLMDDEADVILKETRKDKTVTAAQLDVCYPVDKSSDRKDRFVVALTVDGQSLSGTTQTIGSKSPVEVQLTRKPAGDGFDFAAGSRSVQP